MSFVAFFSLPLSILLVRLLYVHTVCLNYHGFTVKLGYVIHLMYAYF